jgi:hypothetical protein
MKLTPWPPFPMTDDERAIFNSARASETFSNFMVDLFKRTYPIRPLWFWDVPTAASTPSAEPEFRVSLPNSRPLNKGTWTKVFGREPTHDEESELSALFRR